MHRVRIVVAASALLFLALATVGNPHAGPPGARAHPYVPGEILLKFSPGAAASDVAAARMQVNAIGLRQFRSGALHWKLGPNVSVEQALQALQRNPRVQFAEPNYILEMDATPTDPRYPELWGLNNTGQTGGTPGADIDAERAWNVSTGSHSVVVAVIDTGVDYNHPDLAGNIWSNPGEIAGNLVDDDNNGFVDDIRGWDFVNNDNNPFDDNAHGTHVSGTIGAHANNGTGVVGVNWSVSIMPLKFLSAGGTGSTANAILCVDYATDMGADIMSNSWGGGGFSQALLDAINAAAAQEIVFVAAAGNSGSNNDTTPHYPSSYNAPNIIAVMATDHNDARSIWPSGNSSSYGATSVDIAAPGSNILSTTPGNTYQSFNGTSMATPHVSGAAALLRAVSPNLPAAQVRQILMDFADDVPALQGLCVSGGRLNAFFPIAEPDDVPPGSVDDLAVTSSTSNSLFLGWTATGDDGEAGTASGYDLRYSTSPIDETNFANATPASGEPTPGAAGAPQSTEVTGLAPQSVYYFALKVTDEWGNRGTISNLASGVTLPPPTIATATSPDPLAFALLTGQSAAGTLTVSNAGVGTLDWTIPTPTVGGPAAVQEEPLDLEKGEPDPRQGDPVVTGAGGPDAFGYRWIDSDEPGGPTFTWVDIAATGTVITELDGDDELSAVIPLGFTFPFYGNNFDSVRISTNGWMSFTSSIATGTTSFTNQPLPTSAGPENMIAALWDDLHFRSANRAVYISDGTRFIVQYTGVDRITAGSASLTFQMEIRNTGEIYYRYLDLTGQLDSSTVGIQNATKTDGLTVAFNTAYLHDDLEIRIAALPQWLTASPTSGRLFGSASQAVTVAVDASGLDGGTYAGTIHVLSNDPLNPSVDIPVTLVVTGAPAILVSPSSLDFGHVFLGFSRDRTLQVLNTGTAPLTISAITSADPQVTATPSSFTIPAHGSQLVTARYTPTISGPFSTMLTIASNASNTPSLDIPATGSSAPAPTVAVDPASYSETLTTGEMVQRNLRISNGGGSDLVVNLTAEQVAGWPVQTGADQGDDVGIERVGGPDGFGYRFRDSDEPGGPVFDWFDISTIGTAIPMSGTNQNSGSIPLPFTFPFYGNTFSSVRVCTNGWLSFTSSSTDSANATTLPSTGDPENLLAVFHDALHFRGVERARYYNDGGTRFIVQFTGVDRSTTGSNLTFQVILYPGGRIVYQYLSMSGVLNSASIGIQNATRTIGLPVSHNQNYVHNGLAIEFIHTPTWLTVSPASATIPPGGFSDFQVTFDATGAGDRIFNGEIDIATNIPDPAVVVVPATLTSIGLPEVEVDPTSIAYGTRFVGYPHLSQLEVHNTGSSTLNVLSVTSNDPSLIVTEPEAAAVIPLVPGGQAVYTLRWLPGAVGPLNAALTIESDDADEPLVLVPVTGNAVIAPEVHHSPGSFSDQLFAGETSAPGEHVLTLTNTGGSDLTWVMGVRLTDAEVVQHDDPELEEGEDPPAGPEQSENAGGPDMFGYRWRDSDEPGGPIFDWFDISTIGTVIPFTSFDDSNFGPIQIGFAFPFYGQTFTTVRASTNGFLTFTSTLTDSSNGALPSTGSPPNLLAVWHDDLNFRTLQRARYYNDGARFIVQFTGVDRDPTGSEFTFQVILYPSGQIVYQYLTMQGVLDSATIGIQNEARTDGLTVVNNAVYMHDNLAIQFTSVPEWLRITPASGTIPAGGSAQVEVRFDATEMIGGVYQGGFDLVTNDPTVGRIVIPATLAVTGFPAIAAAPPSLDFGTVFVGLSESLDIVISNPGSDMLDVSSIAVNGDYATDTTPFSLPPEGSRTLTVTYTPTTDGPRPGSIAFTSNATGVPVFTVPLTGSALFPPIAGVDPTSIEAAAPPGGSKVKHLQLCNTGGSDLIWDSTVTLLSGVTPPPPVPPLEEIEKGDSSQDGRGNIIERTGGPDAYGYRYIDSDEPGGPVFDWFDISTIGTPIDTGTSGDDVSVFGIPIGFAFPFYGGSYTSVTYNTNGWISPTSTVSSGTFSRFNQMLPTGGTSYPENLLGAFWDDLDFNGATKGHYYSDGTKFIAQWTNVEHFPSGSSYTFQVILRPDGTFRFQYLSMSGTMNSHTVGIQNGDRTIGLTLVHNQATPYVHDGLAIEFFRPPDWLDLEPESGTVPAGGCTDITVTMSAVELEEGDHNASIAISSNDPFHSPILVPVLLHVGEVGLTYLDVEPNTLNLGAGGNTVKATLQLPAPYDPHDVVIETVCVFGGALCANPSPISYSDVNQDGTEELVVKFDRAAFEALCPEGENVAIEVTGEVADTIWFAGTDTIRALRPRVTHPNGGEYLVAGNNVTLTWSAPQLAPASSYTIWLSRDGGSTWEELATGVTGTSYTWNIAGPATTNARIRVYALDQQGVMGYDASDGEFAIAGFLPPPGPAEELEVRRIGANLVLDWKRPIITLQQGPVDHYRVLRATSPQGPFVEIGTPTTESYVEPLASTASSPAVFFKVTAVNAAGETD